VKHAHENALAQDIRDHVLRIFEACNFQDLSGQRIAKVMATLQFVENRIARMMEIRDGAESFKVYAATAIAERQPGLLHGPKLEDEPGHVSQADIDALFKVQGQLIALTTSRATGWRAVRRDIPGAAPKVPSIEPFFASERPNLEPVVDLSAAFAGNVTSQRTGVGALRSTSLILTASTAVILIGASSVPAAAFWGSHPTLTPQPEYGASAVRAPAHRASTVASRSTRKPDAGPVPAALAAKATGPLHIIISLDRQQLTLYSDGHPIAHSRVATGTRSHPTPTGVFSIIQKSRWHRSNLYGDAPMFFMQRITWSGVALHQGVVPNQPASHGCIRLPEAFARQLWTTTKMGARVIIARGDVAPVAIAHPKLFVPKRDPAVSQALKAAEEAWTFARLANKGPIVGAAMSDLPAVDAPEPAVPLAPARVLKPGPVSVFISRKEGRLYVRKGFEPVFDVAVEIEQPNEPIGTHVFTAMAQGDDASMRWTVVSMPRAAKSAVSAADALDRVAIPQEAREQISELLTAGGSLIISDQGLGPETGKGTDFIVLTR